MNALAEILPNLEVQEVKIMVRIIVMFLQVHQGYVEPEMKPQIIMTLKT